ncbi:HAMP domain-containing histidine kinase [Nocardioides carbamazepini]|uniref:sensor histidine kinase n=1 Tax=Nocardioides carbamazepini TaxID=2854259 RepID=UPI00214A1EAB|nr:HAMP domain-containing sensor histidine kinase [Nocardioides carbamazepini]MCR1783965.1 HAMP domain-containing histidine kinase [Nocardioides carbamazepini]
MTFADAAAIVAVAAACAILAGALGLAVGRLVRRRSIRWQLALVAVVPVAGASLGATAIARLMFISAHDLLVMSVVTSVAAVGAIGIALIVAAAIARWSEEVRAQVRVFDATTPEQAGGGTPGTAELRSLADELDRTRDRLRQAHARERRLEEARRELVSWVSHDLRTPLAGIRAMTEALEDDLTTDPGRYHRQIRAEVDRMSGMVDDLFELARIQAGVLVIAPEPVLLADLVSEAIAAITPVAEARGVRVEGAVDEGLEVSADPAGIARVLDNLLANAVRHTRTGGAVEVHGRLAGGHVEIAVSDGCGGLPPDDIARVFDVAWQAAPARTPDGQARGGGLGLAIVKGIVEAHDGHVTVENRPRDVGCRFLVTLPG